VQLAVDSAVKSLAGADLRPAILPGVTDLLTKLAPHATLAIVSGNLEPIGWAKLRAARLDHFFVAGAFGSDHVERAELIKLAAAKMGVAPERVVHFGDALSDVRAAKVVGARVVAVATGIFSLSSLAEEGADVVVQSLEDTGAILPFVLKGLKERG
jgi:phosphoglycolate phosphatase